MVGLRRNCIARWSNVLQEVAGLYCSMGENCIAGQPVYCNGKGLYCNRLLGWSVSQYTKLYCD